MTKAKAKKLMLEYARLVISPTLANKIAQAFGYSLKELNLVPTKVKDFHRMNYTKETAELKAISVHQLAQAIAEKKNPNITIQSMMNGMGSMAEDITEKAIKLI